MERVNFNVVDDGGVYYKLFVYLDMLLDCIKVCIFLLWCDMSLINILVFKLDYYE